MVELKCVLFVFVSCACILLGSGCYPFSRAVGRRVKCDFESNPLERGWRGVRDKYRPFDGGVIEAPGRAPEKCVVIRKGGWESPLIRTAPGTIYRLSFDARTEEPGFWRIFFYDASGREMDADNYSRLYATGGEWERQEFFFEMREGAEFFKAGFDPLTEQPLYLDEIGLRPAGREETVAWMERQGRELPPLDYTPPADRWRHLRDTAAALRNGGDLRIVILGDSIANDVANSLFHLRLERMYPGTQVELIRSVRSGTGCTYYRKGDHVREHVLRHQPDLLIIGGVSHGHDPEAMREVITRVREGCEAEVLVLSGAVSQFRPHHVRRGEERILIRREQQLERNRTFREDLAAMCDEQEVAYMDLRGVWQRYLESTDRSGDWFRRDPVHANSRGKQAIGKMLVRFLSLPDRGYNIGSE